jgi:peroxiredoxin/transglutaminase-like putative cysteine protease
MKLKTLYFIFACLLLIPCCKKTDEQVSRPPDTSDVRVAHSEDEFLKEYVPTEYLDAVKANLKSAGENKDELIKVIKAVKPEERKGASFLIATMPFPDMASIKSEVLLEHIKYAYLVRNKYPWMRNMPEEVFLHYVLPYRCAEEPAEAYRKYFYEQLDPIVSQLTNMADVAHQVNLWLGRPNADGPAGAGRVRFIQTEARDQGPLETLKSGYGRCEEMMIIYMSVARSVGVPCRSAWTTWWAICDNNHAWVEVWLDGNWRPLGGCEPGAPWFENPAKRAAIVYSAAIGAPKSEEIFSSYPTTASFKTASIINSISNYSKTCELNITVLSPQGKKVTETGVAMAVFNWGKFATFLHKKTGKDGSVSFRVGIGEYLLSAGQDNLRAWQMVKTEPDGKLDIILQLSENSAPDGFVFLKYPTPEEAKESFNTPEFYSTVTHKEPVTPVYTAPAESYFAEEFTPDKAPEITDINWTDESGKILLQKIKTAQGNWKEIISAIKEISPDKRDDLFWLIIQMAHLERMESTREFLLENVDYAHLARSKAPYKVSDELFRSYVLNPSFTYLHISCWRRQLYEAFVPLMQPTITETARTVNKWVADNIKVTDWKAGRFSSMPSPLDVYKSRWGDATSVAIFTAAVLRTLSIPARMESDMVEFHNGTAWVPLYSPDRKKIGNATGNEVAKVTKLEFKYMNMVPSGLKVIFSAKGVTTVNPVDQMGIARFKDGYWEEVDYIGRKGLWLLITPGQYLLTAGIRNSNGDPYVYCRQIELESGQGMTINLTLDIPVNLVSDAERTVRQLPKLPDVELPDADGNLHNLKASLRDSNILLAFFSLDNEPSLRMMPLIDSMVKAVRDANVIVWGIYVDSEGKSKFYGDDRLKNLGMTVLFDDEQKVVKEFIPDFDKNKSACLPSTLLINKEGKIVMWCEGYNLDIANVIESACSLLPGGKPAANISERGRMPEITIAPFDCSGPDYVSEGDKYYKEGRYQDAVDSYRKALEECDDIIVWYNLACCYSLLGRVDGALEALKQAIKGGYRDLHWMDNDPDLENIRKDPRYKELRK